MTLYHPFSRADKPLPPIRLRFGALWRQLASARPVRRGPAGGGGNVSGATSAPGDPAIVTPVNGRPELRFLAAPDQAPAFTIC